MNERPIPQQANREYDKYDELPYDDDVWTYAEDTDSNDRFSEEEDPFSDRFYT